MKNIAIEGEHGPEEDKGRISYFGSNDCCGPLTDELIKSDVSIKGEAVVKQKANQIEIHTP